MRVRARVRVRVSVRVRFCVRRSARSMSGSWVVLRAVRRTRNAKPPDWMSSSAAFMQTRAGDFIPTAGEISAVAGLYGNVLS